MSEYVVFGGARSRAMRVLWMLEELGLDYAVVPTLPRSEDVRALNPTGKIPVLVEDGVAISDSVAIMTYLADKHGRLTAPAGTIARAQQDAFVQAVNDEIDAVLWAAARHSFILPEEQRVAGVKDSLRWEFARNEDAIADRMSADGPFVMGEEMCLADILLSHCVGWAGSAKFDARNDRLLAHNAMMRARPAFKRALAAGT
ncbi:glutathione S-transferase family protein [Jannaschia sp. CCS1]|uniref:glutathione S-transferase family protein n=1 Tax=Jannaschia sp. (strain CCS1) TaxID=290400 RepID=UPI000053B7C3|nr:glutathione S-transferase family protein [Jannaschia sp. CCS1]ABD53325.1 glutathione S-transferase-like protein [Jannaschia sp. CCS1]